MTVHYDDLLINSDHAVGLIDTIKAARRAARAANAASLGVAASCQPVPVTFSSRAGSCPLNVAELL